MVTIVDKSEYILISACKNEGEYIEGLIYSVAQQTWKPKVFLIVDDGSIDNTYERAKSETIKYPFLKICRMNRSVQRSFASQVYAANYGYETLRNYEFEYVGFIDADIRIGQDYYQSLLEKFKSNNKLGLAGGTVIDKYLKRNEIRGKGSEEYHVAGGVQFFRRTCYEAIGGYIPVEGGGQDTIAEVMALMKGWEIKTFTDITSMHLRPEGFKKENVFKQGINWGKKFYSIGYHPLYYFGQNFLRISRRPIILGSLSQFFGFLLAILKAEKRPISEEFVSFIRKHQLEMIKKSISQFKNKRLSLCGKIITKNII